MVGYTITLSVSESIKISYCHVSPNYIVSKGDFVKQGDVIGHVGPKNVYGIPGNKYKDSDGNPTGKKVIAKEKISYNYCLINNIISITIPKGIV